MRQISAAVTFLHCCRKADAPARKKRKRTRRCIGVGARNGGDRAALDTHMQFVFVWEKHDPFRRKIRRLLTRGEVESGS